MSIIPTVGRVMLFYPDHRTEQNNFSKPRLGEPCAALVASVNAENMVNLTVSDASGMPHPRRNVPVVQEGETPPATGYYATWMPYQVGQAKNAVSAAEPPDAISVQMRAAALDCAMRTIGVPNYERVLEAAEAYLVFLSK